MLRRAVWNCRWLRRRASRKLDDLELSCENGAGTEAGGAVCGSESSAPKRRGRPSSYGAQRVFNDEFQPLGAGVTTLNEPPSSQMVHRTPRASALSRIERTQRGREARPLVDDAKLVQVDSSPGARDRAVDGSDHVFNRFHAARIRCGRCLASAKTVHMFSYDAAPP